MFPGNIIKVVYLKLRKYWGWANYSNNTIELDYRLKGKKHLEILVHEMIHHLNQKKTEEEVKHDSIVMTNTLWAEGYRRPDNSNEVPLQDGSL